METRDKQRVFPFRLPQEITPDSLQPDKVAKLLPQILPDTVSEKGFCMGLLDTGEIISQYVFCPEEAKSLQEKTGGVNSHPIYHIAPENLPKKEELYNLHVDVVAGPPLEHKTWTKILTLKEIRKEEKDLKKEIMLEEISQIPKEEIWKTFLSEKTDDGYIPAQGYKPSKDTKKWWMPGLGNPWAKTWIIGLYPSTEEAKAGQIYAGGSGLELAQLLAASGMTLEKDVYLDNLLKKYMPPKSKLGANVKLEHMWLLRRQLAYYKPERVICLGAEVFKEFAGSKYSFKNMRATWVDISYPGKLAETEFGTWNGRIAGTFHPAGCLRPEGRKNLPLFRQDIRDLLEDRQQQEVNPENEEIRTIDGVRRWVKEEIAFLDSLPEDEYILYPVDTEGYGGSPDTDEFICLQFGYVLCKKNPTPQDHSEEKKGSWLQAPKVDIIPIKASERTTTLLLLEQVDPEEFEKETFLHDREVEQDFFEKLQNTEEDSEEEKVEEEKPPIITLAESEADRTKIIQTHGEKSPNRKLVIFNLQRRVNHLKGYEKEIAEELKKISTHPKTAGFAFTNANYDRIRMHKSFGEDLIRNSAVFTSPLDTMLGEHVNDESSDLGLKPALNKRFGWARQDRELDLFYKKYSLENVIKKIKEACRKSEWRLYPWSLLKKYAAKDVYGCGALIVAQYEEMMQQEQKYQNDRLERGSSNTLRQAFYISTGAIHGTYEMNYYGMPVGEEGFDRLNQLTNFYAKHERELIKEYQGMVYDLTGFRDANPSSPEELGFILFNPKSPLARRGIEPWKESGNKGRLWEEIPDEEIKGCTPSTDGESLEIIASSCKEEDIQKFLMRLSEIKTILTIREDFLPDISYAIAKKKGILGRLNMHTMNLHTAYTPTLDTARCRSVPNLSTFPKEEQKRVKKILGEAPPFKIREIICAPPGAKLLNRDWMTAEVLGLGYLSGDPNMKLIISKMSEGLDFHCKLAIPSYPIIGETIHLIAEHPTPPTDWLNGNVPEEKRKEFCEKWAGFTEERKSHNKSGPLTEGESHQMTKVVFKQERSNIKPVTFGVPYGRSAKAIQKQLNREYYVEDIRGPDGNIIQVTEAEAQAMIDSYKIKEFNVAWGYLEAQAKQGVELGYLRDPWGYIRHFPQGMKPDEVTRKSYNYQIQHLVAAVMNMAMADWIRRREKLKLRSYAYATLYDNIGWVAYDDELQEVWDVSQTVMTTERPIGPKDGENPEMANWHFPTDGEFSHTWEGKTIPLESLGVDPKPHRNLTGLES